MGVYVGVSQLEVGGCEASARSASMHKHGRKAESDLLFPQPTPVIHANIVSIILLATSL